MNGFPKDFDISCILGSPLNQLRLGPYDLQLVFDGSGIKWFVIESQVKVFEDNRLVATWGDPDGWDNLAFQKLLNAVPTAFRVIEPKTLEITFDNQLSLQILDDQDMYESVTITFDDPAKAGWVI